ncbi:hypothetical protein CYMTET_44023 [Cymbomonas tetramitiformis]|uniref:RecA family profile 1 domain-containing protein n=1 Tax=Cymbomonas tetramitiformis TaxID=36881 RepID=A0AAE0C2Q3_9CHLO|nr:hypothetical protein CYMTET_44023 [Cymbomonas tetramitiformis]
MQVVDSISNLFRDLDVADATDLSERSNLLYRIARLLKEYAYVYDVAVVVTNHVMDCVDLNAPTTKATIPFPYHTSGRSVMPALGLYWGSSLNLRIFLSRHEASDHLKGPARRLQVLFAPNLPLVKCEFSVDNWGVHA